VNALDDAMPQTVACHDSLQVKHFVGA
jgi:hypothetical protein